MGFFKSISKCVTLFFVGLIVLYKRMISPFLPGACRFLPTCSSYGIEALQTHGVIKGLVLTAKRIAKCHPIKALGGDSGLDPVPPKQDK